MFTPILSKHLRIAEWLWCSRSMTTMMTSKPLAFSGVSILLQKKKITIMNVMTMIMRLECRWNTHTHLRRHYMVTRHHYVSIGLFDVLKVRTILELDNGMECIITAANFQGPGLESNFTSKLISSPSLCLFTVSVSLSLTPMADTWWRDDQRWRLIPSILSAI